MFNTDIIQTFLNIIDRHGSRDAFCISKRFYTYNEFAQSISKIRNELQSHNIENKSIGLVENDDLETYASIFALWLEGLAYVPISPDAPFDRNRDVIEQAGITSIIDSSDKDTFSNYNLIKSSALSNTTKNLKPKVTSEEELVYILFTSGTTGRPKGVPISRGNLSAFVNAYKDLGVNITIDDKCLQMFNLTFDLSVISYLMPLLNGACVYTIPKDEIKYSYVFELLDESGITITMMVPSIIQYLRPYFDEMDFPNIKYSLFCGEALDQKLVEEWQNCATNAEIINTYGPTEHTIICSYYKYNVNNTNEYNGVLSIGKKMGSTELFIVDRAKNILPKGKKGELCLVGPQLTPGYWNNEEKNAEAFFTKNIDGNIKRLYKTGDLCFEGENGNIFYSGRLDFQTKIQGFRVELSEVEFHVKSFLGKINAVALAIENRIGNNEIVLIIENEKMDTTQMFEHLGSKMPPYMMPTQIRFEPSFPLNINGKIDRKRLKIKFDLEKNDKNSA